MRRVALFSMIPVALLGAVVAARSVAHFANCAGGACASEAAPVTAGKGKDPLMAFVCERSCATKIAYQEADLAPQPGAKAGDLTRRPVSGVVFQVAADNPTVEHQGRRYRLCCSGCEQKFRAHPARFVAS